MGGSVPAPAPTKPHASAPPTAIAPVSQSSVPGPAERCEPTRHLGYHFASVASFAFSSHGSERIAAGPRGWQPNEALCEEFCALEASRRCLLRKGHHSESKDSLFLPLTNIEERNATAQTSVMRDKITNITAHKQVAWWTMWVILKLAQSLQKDQVELVHSIGTEVVCWSSKTKRQDGGQFKTVSSAVGPLRLNTDKTN
ncbi:hypothetical protein NDU88_004962 [Pleurodeles waltl]|uniref:Uncharacterized protein n=1 Tax=Pleurodeles waltl TaxID=8319 RepID=A0AAV7QGV5_PLEWA|nr:hypothetical protein NDU88_004962 [Pleurodeles waltl]